jgi:hypothetical protein
MEPDPRWGLLVPVAASTTISMPTKTPLTAESSINTDLVNPANPLSVRTHEVTSTVEGRTWKTTYDASTRTFTSTLPTAGQQHKQSTTKDVCL